MLTRQGEHAAALRLLVGALHSKSEKEIAFKPRNCTAPPQRYLPVELLLLANNGGSPQFLV